MCEIGGRSRALLFGECEASFLPDSVLIPVHTGRDQCLVGILAVEQSYVKDSGSWQETRGMH